MNFGFEIFLLPLHPRINLLYRVKDQETQCETTQNGAEQGRDYMAVSTYGRSVTAIMLNENF